MDSLSSYSIVCSLSPVPVEYLLISMWKVCQRIEVNAQCGAVVYQDTSISYTARITGRNGGVRLTIVSPSLTLQELVIGASGCLTTFLGEQWSNGTNECRISCALWSPGSPGIAPQRIVGRIAACGETIRPDETFSTPPDTEVNCANQQNRYNLIQTSIESPANCSRNRSHLLQKPSPSPPWTNPPNTKN